ncbi:MULTISPECIES: aldo/keto reductase [unclassified Streptomyces]|uniref:aldo/keto reductase n=1 Tax=unclassified Streptomyces TaxID=2593676 RepID=UPI002E141B3F|nr:aldo/keto reductase [Streptomyces sp. NBC_01296]
MRYATFGHRTGLRVSEYALGTANFGTGWGAGAEPDEARRIFDRFAEAGGTFLDTADTYQFGERGPQGGADSEALGHGQEGRHSDLGAVVHTESTGQKSAVVDAVLAIAEEIGVTPAQVSVAWVRERAARSRASLIPIIGPRSLTQLDSYLGALDVQLTPEQFARLSEVSAVALGVPHEAIAGSLSGIQGGNTSCIIAPAAVG